MRSTFYQFIEELREKFLGFGNLIRTPGIVITSLFRNLRLSLFLIILVGLLPAYGIIVFATNQFRNVVEEQIYQETLQHANLISDRIESLANQFRQILVLASLDPEIHEPTHEECSRILNNVINTYSPTMMNIGIAGSDGIVICSLPEEDECINADVSSLSFFSLALNSKEPDIDHFTISPNTKDPSLGFTLPSYDVQSANEGDILSQIFVVGDYSVSPHNNTANLGFGAPVFDSQGKVEEVVYNLIATDTLSEIIHDPGLPENSTIILLDRNNNIIGYYPESEAWIGKSISDTDYEISADQTERVFLDKDQAGVERLIAYSPLTNISQGDIKLLISVPRSTAFAPLNQTLMITFLASIITASLAVIIIWRLGNYLFERQMRSRIELAQRIVNGDLNAEIEPNRTDEQIKLINEFDRVIGNLKKRELEHQQADKAIRHRMARIEALSSTDIRLNAQLDLQSLLRTSCMIVSETLHISSCSIRLYDSDQDAYILSTTLGLDPGFENEADPLPENTYRQYETIDEPFFWTRDSLTDPVLPRGLKKLMALDWIISSVRIKHEGQRIGLLFLFARDKKEAASLDDKLLVKGLADRIGLSLANALLVDELRSEQAKRASLLQKVISAQEEERLRIARELHDETSQSLSAINVYIDTATLCLEEQAIPKAIQQMSMTKDVVNGMLGDIHSLISDLRPRLLDEKGLIPAISWYAQQRLDPVGISLVVEENERGLRLPAVVETELFRIFQEIITNIIRHSHATRVNIQFGKEDDEIFLCVQDNGVGFEEKPVGKLQKGFGLTGIHERVSNLGGTVQIESTKNQGTQIQIRIPTYQIESYV